MNYLKLFRVDESIINTIVADKYIVKHIVYTQTGLVPVLKTSFHQCVISYTVASLTLLVLS